ncbi:MAG: CDP-6-deoxy-delta-3,4-glucoseen reductase [Gammaproteobacteria bacterium]|nr:CDP-6-deoxy-delta-3,4-glucoseen reductase [Gammaproteobacteria bacterium]
MGFTVRIEPSGHEFAAEGSETVLEAALRHGFNLPYSCRNGACATCKGKVIAGVVDYGTYESKALSESEKRAGMALFCRARPLSDVIIEVREIGAVRGIAVKTLPCRVVRMDKLAPDVMVLYLKLPQNERLQFLAGQYVDILLRDGRRRSFSLANAPHDDEALQLHIRHLPGGHFSEHVFTRMKEKDLLRFQGPLGTFFLREEGGGAGAEPAGSGRPIILMAGGTGFAPMKAILEHTFYVGLQRPIHLYWGVRARPDLYLHERVQAWAQEHGNFRYTPVLSDPLPGDCWAGRCGWVHEAVVQDYPDLSAHEVYASGPPPMIEAGKAAFGACGLPDDRLFYDSFERARDPIAP